MLHSRIGLVSLLVVAALTAAPALATTIVYDATMQVGWSNGYIGTPTDSDSSVAVTVNYDGTGGFEITAINFAAASGSLGGRQHVLHESSSLASSGTIVGASASGVINYVGTADLGAIGGPVVTLTNSGGNYAGTASGSGPWAGMFVAGDTYALTADSFGSYTPSLGLPTNYDHRPTVTYINFLTPEPAGALLLLAGLPLLRRRRGC